MREIVFGDRSLDVGRSLHCDIVVHDPAVPDHAAVIERASDGVVVYDVRRRRRRHLGVGAVVQLGDHHQLQRVRLPPSEASLSVGRTEPMAMLSRGRETFALQIGSGAESRRVRLAKGRPMRLGTAKGNDVVVYDRAVSGRHCRFEHVGGRVLVRDLGSRNGTWVSGKRVHRIEVGAGARLRIGRTDVRVVAEGDHDEAWIVASQSMRALMGEVQRLAELNRHCVVVYGESGVGKEGIARALHRFSPRCEGPFVAYNGAGFAEHLVASQLFGHAKGAFTGADAEARGAFEQAHGGTLFLDEIGELPLSMQAQLLRVLETWTVRPVGAERERAIDVRLVTATHRDLRQLVKAGRFRLDLLHRLQQLVLRVPPLRDRPEDIAPLARHFLRDAALDEGARRTFSECALDRLHRHFYEGNVRELRNIVVQAATQAQTERVTSSEICAAIDKQGLSDGSALRRTPTVSFELEEVMRRCHGNMSAAARALGIPRTTLRDRLKRIEGAEPLSYERLRSGG